MITIPKGSSQVGEDGLLNYKADREALLTFKKIYIHFKNTEKEIAIMGFLK